MELRRCICMAAALFFLVVSGCGSKTAKDGTDGEFTISAETIKNEDGDYVFLDLPWGISPEETAKELGISLSRFAEDNQSVLPENAQRAYFVPENAETPMYIFGAKLNAELFFEYEYGKLKNVSAQLEQGISEALFEKCLTELASAYGEPAEQTSTAGTSEIRIYNWENENTKLSLMHSATEAGIQYISFNFMMIRV